jgi:hypothetical protein
MIYGGMKTTRTGTSDEIHTKTTDDGQSVRGEHTHVAKMSAICSAIALQEKAVS